MESIVKPEKNFVVLFFLFRAFMFQLVAQTHELSPIVFPVIVLCHIELCTEATFEVARLLQII